jgi:serine/threonine-protein kinase
MPLKTRALRAGKLVLLVIALAATFLLFAAAAMRISLRTLEVRVPDLTGKTANQATAIAATLGLTVKVDDSRRIDPKIAAGRIAAQEPPANSVARRQRSIKVWLSAGSRATIVPALVGETARTAQLQLEQDGLKVATVSEIESSEYAADSVVAQDPAPDGRGDQVSLLVNRGDRGTTYVMPDLIGVNGDRAADLLRAHGFRVALVGQNPYPGVPSGIVIRQQPQAGFQVAPGEAISLEVSR